ncbi:MAG: hypothetical protein JJLCMIEE_02151 [Acidimicrobiales bacterium]|nr:MAG: hypothetical protein EDR02_13190 [Actinomycetota bacterium]MBV6509084.1 hypothetical protein [Acidimicrobiales bacterium]RIK03720.1 MAG: hypothetical protein DCC48_15870 [Acidobacteriota bacterium]
MPARVVVLVAAGIGLVGFVAVLLGTPDGAVVSTDSATYVGVARNIVDGLGVTEPFTQVLDPFTPAEALAFDGAAPLMLWPPLYPLVLALPGLFGIDPTSSAATINALCLAAAAFLVVLLTFRLATGRAKLRLGAGAVAGMALLLPYVFLQTFLFALSEPLYIVLSVGALFALADYLRSPRVVPLVALTLLSSAAAMTRFIGLALVATSVVAVLTLAPGERRVRLRHAALAALAAVPPIVWSLYSSSQAARSVLRVGWHPPHRSDLEGMVQTTTEWFVPPGAPTALRVVVLGAVVAASAVAILAIRKKGPGSGALVACWLYVVLYVCFLLASVTLLEDRFVPLEGRQLAPLWPVTVVAITSGAARWWRRDRPTLVIAAAALVAVGLVGTGLYLAVDTAEQLAGGPPTLAQDAGTAEIDDFLADLPVGTVVFSNSPAAVYDATQRYVMSVPQRDLPGSGTPNPDIDTDLAELAEIVDGNDTVIVMYSLGAFLSPYLVTTGELQEALGVEAIAEFPTAVVLSAKR